MILAVCSDGMNHKNAQRKTSSKVVSPARRVTDDILRRVEDEGAYAALLLASTATENLRAADRGLAYELVLGTLRWQLWLDRLIEHYAGGRSAQSLDAPVRRALRVGLYQLRFLTRVPASAAVNEAVNLAHVGGFRSAAGFINAVLRRATREPDYDPANNITDEIERMAVATSHPHWMIARWVTAFGADEALKFARANNEAPPIAFRLNPLRARESAEVLSRITNAEEAPQVASSRVAPEAWRLTEKSPQATALLQESAQSGLVYLQDEASQLVAHVVGARAGERILDVCAAPGSKSTHLAMLTRDQGSIIAGDLYAHRLRVVQQSAARQGIKSVTPIALDATMALPFRPGSFDRVLVDAPCSGTGTLRHNPEIKWRISPDKVFELAAQQRRILAVAAQMVRPGGRLVYATCSVEREENEDVLAAFTATHEDFRILSDVLPRELQTSSGAARTWPQREGTDGFFLAVMERALNN